MQSKTIKASSKPLHWLLSPVQAARSSTLEERYLIQWLLKKSQLLRVRNLWQWSNTLSLRSNVRAFFSPRRLIWITLSLLTSVTALERALLTKQELSSTQTTAKKYWMKKLLRNLKCCTNKSRLDLKQNLLLAFKEDCGRRWLRCTIKLHQRKRDQWLRDTRSYSKCCLIMRLDHQ